jgi:hypothetical protein
MHIWGYKERNINLVFERMIGKLKLIDPKNEPQYKRCQSMIKELALN